MRRKRLATERSGQSSVRLRVVTRDAPGASSCVRERRDAGVGGAGGGNQALFARSAWIVSESPRIAQDVGRPGSSDLLKKSLQIVIFLVLRIVQPPRLPCRRSLILKIPANQHLFVGRCRQIGASFGVFSGTGAWMQPDRRESQRIGRVCDSAASGNRRATGRETSIARTSPVRSRPGSRGARDVAGVIRQSCRVPARPVRARRWWLDVVSVGGPGQLVAVAVVGAFGFRRMLG